MGRYCQQQFPHLHPNFLLDKIVVPMFRFYVEKQVIAHPSIFKTLTLRVYPSKRENWKVHLGQTGSLSCANLNVNIMPDTAFTPPSGNAVTTLPATSLPWRSCRLNGSCLHLVRIPDKRDGNRTVMVDILWAQQSAVWNLLLIHHCRLHHSSFFFLLTSHVPHLLSVPHLLFPQINLPCGAVDFHILSLFVSLFYIFRSKSFQLEIYLNVCLAPISQPINPPFHIYFTIAFYDQEIIISPVPSALIHSCYDSTGASGKPRRIMHALRVPNVLCFDREHSLTCGFICEQQ